MNDVEDITINDVIENMSKSTPLSMVIDQPTTSSKSNTATQESQTTQATEVAINDKVDVFRKNEATRAPISRNKVGILLILVIILQYVIFSYRATTILLAKFITNPTVMISVKFGSFGILVGILVYFLIIKN